jgi:tRNA (guanine9-N1)-methyltransferase
LFILDDVFIIGGLVDRTIQKYASLNRAEKLGIPARSLPIRPFMKQRTCLNLDHILSIVCKFIEVKDWKLAFEHGAPDRWKNDK